MKTMVEITMTTRGRITLPAAMRHELKLAAGSKLRVEEAGGVITLVPRRASKNVFEKYAGTVDFGIKGGRRGIIKSIRDMRDGR